MFDGKVKSSRVVSLAGKGVKGDSKTTRDLMENARKQREARAIERQRSQASTKIQRIIRSKLVRVRMYRSMRIDFDVVLKDSGDAYDGKKFASLCETLPVFYDNKVDQERLLSLNQYLSKLLGSQERSMFDLLGIGIDCICQQDGRNIVRSIANLLRVSTNVVFTSIYEGKCSESSMDDLLSVLVQVNLVESPIIQNKLFGTYVSLYMAEAAAVVLRHRVTANSTSDYESMLSTILQHILVQALGWVDREDVTSMLMSAPREVKERLHTLRQVAVRGIASQLLSQPPLRHWNTDHDIMKNKEKGDAKKNEISWTSWISAEDWLSILTHCLPPYSNANRADSKRIALSSVERLNLLHNFVAAFASVPSNQRGMFVCGVSAGPTYSQLGKVFINLASSLLGFWQEDTDIPCKADGAAAIASLFGTTSVITQNYMFNSPSSGGSLVGNVGIPGGVGSLGSIGGSKSVEEQPSEEQLPVLWMIQEMSGNHINHQQSSVGASVGVMMMDVEDNEDHMQESVSEEVYSDYLNAAGWKKLEYRIDGVRKRIIMAQDAALNKPTGTTSSREFCLASTVSLRNLTSALTHRDMVSVLTNLVEDHHTITAPCNDSMLSSRENMDISGNSGVVETATDSSNINSIGGLYSSVVVSLYAQLLLSFPADIHSLALTENTQSQLQEQDRSPFTVDKKSSLLIALAFSNPAQPLAKRLWNHIQFIYGTNVLDTMVSYEDNVLVHTKGFTELAERIPGATAGGEKPASTLAGTGAAGAYRQLLFALYLFCGVFLQQLAAIDDETLLEQEKIFTMAEIRNIVVFLKRWLFKLYWVEPLFDIDSSIVPTKSASAGAVSAASECTTDRLLKLNCQQVATKLFNHFCYRNERRGFLQAEDWGWPHLSGFDMSVRDDPSGASEVYGSTLLLNNSKVKAVLTFIPQVIPFKQRVKVFQALLARDKAHYYSSHTHGAAAALGLTGALRVELRRDALVADAYEQLHDAGAKLKGMIKVEFISEQGLNEAGIDGGGLFKEFIDSFAKQAFSPTYGLFLPTSHQLLTPNPSSGLMGSNHLRYFNFVGKILGKSLYENILLESEFAGGFLNFLLDRKNTLDDLYYLDEQMYRSLMQLKHHANNGGDLESLELFFETSRMEYGKVVTQELMPGGSSVRVTKANVHAYIHQLANQKLNIDVASQCRALRAGFQSLVPLEWIRMFNTKELQLLISGDQRRIDLADMQAHTTYGSGFHPSQPYIQSFWEVVDGMTAVDQGNLLKFVTSCSRQPLLGFGQIQPPFCIQKIPAYASQYTGLEPPQPGEAPRLPSAATCMNLLKLPMYDSVETLREKLLYAIRSNSGFELS